MPITAPLNPVGVVLWEIVTLVRWELLLRFALRDLFYTGRMYTIHLNKSLPAVLRSSLPF